MTRNVRDPVPAHVPIERTAGGVGVYLTFYCMACARTRAVVGRKKARVRGLMTFVCAQCYPKGRA